METFTVQCQEPRVCVLQGNDSVGGSTDHTPGTPNGGDGTDVRYDDTRRSKLCY
jgi:hypothetical protein